MIRAALLPLLLAGKPAIAQPAPIPSRATELIPILNGRGDPDDSFTPAFRAAVATPQLRAIAAQLTAQHGRALRIASARPTGLNRYDLTIAYDRADIAATLTLDAIPPARIAGLVITGATARLGSLDAAVAALRAFPGTTGLAVARLDDSGPVMLATLNADRPQAVASSFKLLILAELVRSIDAGTRRWTDVVPLAIRAVPGGILQDWPQDAPLTLHSLATLMISRSDNSAADTLIALLGRDRIADMTRSLGWPASPGNDPLLTTLELAKLKGISDTKLADRYVAASPAARRALLAGPVADTPRSAIDLAALETRPRHIDTLEWYASPATLIRTLDWFRRHPGPAAATARAILAVNPGLRSPAPFAYVGYKGGSEAGVLALSYLLRTQDGRWYAISASWNDPVAILADQQLIALTTRLTALIASPPEP